MRPDGCSCANTSMVTSLLTRGVAVSISSAARTVQSCGKSIFTLVVDVATQKFAKRVRPVCTPGLPYKDSPMYNRINWRIFSPTKSARFLTRYWRIFAPFLSLYRTYTLSMFLICFPTFKPRFEKSLYASHSSNEVLVQQEDRILFRSFAVQHISDPLPQRLNMELDLKSLIGLYIHRCTYSLAIGAIG